MSSHRSLLALLAASLLAAGCGGGSGPGSGPAGKYDVSAGTIQYDPPWMETIVDSPTGSVIPIHEMPDETWLVEDGSQDDELVIRCPSEFCAARTRDYNRTTRSCSESDVILPTLTLPGALINSVVSELCPALLAAEGFGEFASLVCGSVPISFSSATIRDVTTTFNVTWAEKHKTFSGSQGFTANVHVTGTLGPIDTVVWVPGIPVPVPVVIPATPFDEEIDVAATQALDGERCDSCSPCSTGGSGGE